MLELDSDRWSELTVWSGDANILPNHLRDWIAALGLPSENSIYLERINPLILHQATIVNSAFAVVPYLVDVADASQTDWGIEYLTDVALVEARRLHNGVHFHKNDADPFPDWLMGDYYDSIARSRNLADNLIDDEPNADRKRQLVSLKPALFGDAELAFRQW